MESSIKIKGSVAIIELGGSHDECLYTQLVALKKENRDVILITDQEIQNRNPHFEPLVDETLIMDTHLLKKKRFGELRRLLKLLERKGVTQVVLNTAQGEIVRDLCLLALFTSIEFIGIIHTTRKFKGSFTQRIINRKVKKYLLLSEYLLSTIKAPHGVKVGYFYPITLPEINKTEHAGINITIIGGIEKRRKDLEGFCLLLKTAPSTVQFIFLGTSHPESTDAIWLRNEIRSMGKEEQVKLYDAFVDQKEFLEVLATTDMILPLVHPNTPSAEQYFRNQISGAMNVSFSYKIPMLLHEFYRFIEEMQEASFYYNLKTGLGDITKQMVDQKVVDMKAHEKYNQEFQEQKYLDFIFDR